MNESVPPITADYVEFHARHRPTAMALVNGPLRVTYAQFDHDLGLSTRALREFGLAPGATVAVSTPWTYVHWLLLLACENLGLVSGSFLPGEPQDGATLVERADLVLADREVTGSPVRRFQQLSPGWIAAAASASSRPGEVLRIRRPLDAPQRIRRSSGTTGGRKIMIASRGVEEHWIRHFLDVAGYSSATRFLILSPFTVGGVYARATACLRLGATCLANLGLGQLAAEGCTHVWMQPRYLEQALAVLPPDFVRLEGLTVESAGSPLSRELRARTLLRLAGEVTNGYGSNEVGPICAIDAKGVGTVLPGVELEIVDDADRPVPAGAVGNVRVRTPSMVAGYVDNPEATARCFRAGWFYSGDAGRIVADGRVRLEGRRDELVNVGGIKADPELYETDLRSVAGVADAAVVGLTDRDDSVTLGIAYVPAAGVPDQRVRAAIAEMAASWGAPFRLLAVEAVPRTDAGKIQRGRVRERFGVDATRIGQ